MIIEASMCKYQNKFKTIKRTLGSALLGEPSDGAAPCDPGREGWDPSLESETVSWFPFAPFALVEEMQAVSVDDAPYCPCFSRVGVREDDGHGVSSEASSFILCLLVSLCHVSCVCSVCTTLYLPVSWLY
jgi:hypothetical protein